MPPADPTPTPAPAAPEAMDKTLAILFDTVEGETTAPAPTEEFGRSLSDALAAPDDPTPKPDDKPNDDAPPPKPDDAAPKPGDPDFKPIKVRKPAPAPTPTPAPAAPAPAPAPAPTPEPKADEGTDDLLDEERERYELMKFAESKDPVKFKGYAKKTLEFFTAHKAKLAELSAANGGEVDLEDPKYLAWLDKNQPNISPTGTRALERAMIEDRATAKAREEVGTVKEELFRRDQEPQVKREADKFYIDLVNESLPDEVKAIIKEKGSEEASKTHALEIEIANEVAGAAAADIEEFIRLTRKNPETGRAMRAYDANNSQHVRVLTMVNDQCATFKQNGGKYLVRDGKTFLTRDEYYSMPEAQRAPYWTFSNVELVKIARLSAKEAIAGRIKAEQSRLERWSKRGAAPAAPVPPATPSPSPAPRPSPSVGGNGAAPVDTPSKLMSVMMGDG